VRTFYDRFVRSKARFDCYREMIQPYDARDEFEGDLAATLEDGLRRAVVYRATNLLTYFNAEGRDGRNQMSAVVRGAKVVSPHPRMWIEATSDDPSHDFHLGWLVVRSEKAVGGVDGDDDSRRHMGFSLAFNRTGFYPLASCFWITDKTGACPYIDTLGKLDMGIAPIGCEPLEAGPYVVFLLFAMGFLNCRNIVQREWAPPRQMVRQAQRSNDPPPVTYRTIDVTPVGTSVVGRPPTDNHPGVAKHIQRGHFKRFSEDRPLFGRHVGQYWWEQHARGTPARGVVFKDYNVDVTA
jgi:hypothetical protein